MTHASDLMFDVDGQARYTAFGRQGVAMNGHMGCSFEDWTFHVFSELQDCARSALVPLEMLIHQHLGVAEQAILRTRGPTSYRRVWG